ncbi:MAG TPA: ABC-2 family transporter protein [Acidobacteriota bacterium]|nr:ABC-2 family transporter protein [Acidobacteriota bacterium]
MSGLVDMYTQQFKTTLAYQLQYRAALFIWLIGQILEPLVFLVVWSAVSHSNGGGTGGFTEEGFAAYYIALMVVNHLTFTWIMFEYEYRIRQGTLSFALLRPVHPIHSDIADNISYKLISLPAMLTVAALLSVAFRPSFQFAPWAVIAFVPALAMAFLVRFLLEWTLAQSAFWTTRVNAANQVYFALALFLSGQVAPLSLLPAPIQILASVLPFRWMISFPVELLLGRLTPVQALRGLEAQAAWLVLSAVLLRVVWRAGIKIYSAVGA